MVTGGGAHLQQTHTKKYLSSIYSSIILHHKSAAAVLVCSGLQPYSTAAAQTSTNRTTAVPRMLQLAAVCLKKERAKEKSERTYQVDLLSIPPGYGEKNVVCCTEFIYSEYDSSTAQDRKKSAPSPGDWHTDSCFACVLCVSRYSR